MARPIRTPDEKRARQLEQGVDSDTGGITPHIRKRLTPEEADKRRADKLARWR